MTRWWWWWRRSYPKAAEYPDAEEYPKEAAEYPDEVESPKEAAEYPDEEEYPSPRVELNLFKQVSCWTRAANYYLEFPWNALHMSILGGYFGNLSTTCDFPELPCAQFLISHQPRQWEQWEPHIVISFIEELKEMFVVPTLNPLHQTLDRITRFHLLEAFLALLLQLLYHKTDATLDPFRDRIENLEKELRSILTILGDKSWTLESEFQNLLPEFEAMANQAGSLVHYLFFSADRSIGKTDEGISAVVSKIDLLKADLQSSISVPPYTTPTTSIVDSILILDSVVDDLEDLLNREDDPIPDVKDQINLLHHELLLSHSSIKDMRSPQPSEIEELKEPLMRIGGMAHQAEYLITSFMVKDAPLWYVINRLNHLIQKVEIIRTELQVIAQNYRFGGLKATEYFTAELPLHDRRIDEVTVGFEDKATEILDHLVGGGTESLQVISILGMPGLGKTTLAKKLYNHPLVDYTFDKLSWCVVSQTYERRSVLANILICINSELRKDEILMMEEIRLGEGIHKTLMGRRYLIVLDDIWDSNVLDELLVCFPDDRNGSRVLFTSRNKDVAPHNSIMHELPFLSDEQCWELLEMKAFGNRRSCPASLQGIGKKIAARCCGLPLTVVVIAGVLSTVGDDESTWEEVGGSLGSYIDGEDNSVMQILELSYKHLPDHLKPCFLYFGEFKEDEAISVGKLKRLWVAEGFIRKEKDKSAENIAGEYLMELIDKSMVKIGKRRIDGRGAKTCVVHDLLRDLCLKKSKEECFLKYWNSDCHTIYEKGHRVRAFEKAATLSYCQHVRSFVSDCVSDSFYVRDMRLLRVLHFETIDSFDKCIFGIEYLVNLRFLVISSLPTWIDRLVNLEYVRVNSKTYLRPTIAKMKKLRYLRASNAEYGNDWNTSNQINTLEHLSEIRIREAKDEELLKCSPHLRKLKCYYDPDERRTCPQFDLRFLTQLDSLYVNGLLREDFGFPSNIVKLTLRMSGLPWEQMSIIGRLEFLEVLKLRKCSFEGERWDTGDGEFQKLKFLQLENLCCLSIWNVASNEPFPRLQQLILINCSKLQEIPSEIGEITTLEVIEVKRGCSYSLVESAERIKAEQRDMGNEELRVNISTGD